MIVCTVGSAVTLEAHVVMVLVDVTTLVTVPMTVEVETSGVTVAVTVEVRVEVTLQNGTSPQTADSICARSRLKTERVRR